jgi:hypothetical protein
MDNLRFPVGKFTQNDAISNEERAALIDQIAHVPVHLHNAIAGLRDDELTTSYRPEGWTHISLFTEREGWK